MRIRSLRIRKTDFSSFLTPSFFVERNLDTGLEGERWYFQDTRSYCKYGSYPIDHVEGLAEDELVGQLVCLREQDLFQIVDCEGLAKVVLECAQRRRAAGAKM